MKIDFKSLAKDKNVLRIVVILSAANVLGYLLLRELDAIALFAVIGFLTSYFSKNMIVVLLTALVATNFLIVSRRVVRVREGMATGSDDEDDEEASHKKTKKGKQVKGASSAVDEELASGRKDRLADAGPVGAGPVDKKKTSKLNQEHVSDSLSDDSKHAIGKKQQSMYDKNEKLMEQLEMMTPAVEKSMQLLEKVPMEKIDVMVDKISSMMGKLGNVGGGLLAGK